MSILKIEPSAINTEADFSLGSLTVSGNVNIGDATISTTGTGDLAFATANGTFDITANTVNFLNTVASTEIAPGDFGAAGYTGSLGYTGSRGTDGIIGVDGYTGSRGDTGVGYTGSSGVINGGNPGELLYQQAIYEAMTSFTISNALNPGIQDTSETFTSTTPNFTLKFEILGTRPSDPGQLGIGYYNVTTDTRVPAVEYADYPAYGPSLYRKVINYAYGEWPRTAPFRLQVTKSGTTLTWSFLSTSDVVQIQDTSTLTAGQVYKIYTYYYLDSTPDSQLVSIITDTGGLFGSATSLVGTQTSFVPAGNIGTVLTGQGNSSPVFSSNLTLSGNIVANAVYTNSYFYANGSAFTAAGVAGYTGSAGVGFTGSAGTIVDFSVYSGIFPSIFVDGNSATDTTYDGTVWTEGTTSAGKGYQQGGMTWNATTGNVTVPQTGLYQVSWTAYHTNSADAHNQRFLLRVNGQNYIAPFSHVGMDSVSTLQHTVTATINLNANDTISIAGVGTATWRPRIFGGSGHTYLQVVKISQVGYTGSGGTGFTGSVGFVGSAGVGFTGSASTAVGFTGSAAPLNIPVVNRTSSYTLTTSDVGDYVNITTGGVTVPAGIFSSGDVVSIYNNSASPQTITQGASVTMYLVGTATTGNRTLAQRGLATLLCVGSNEFVITGGGLT